ncbi:MAG: restriction endonuclease [Armatimonadota bacterium]
MSIEEPTVWGIHASKTGDADTLFRTHSVIALGWHKIGDLTGLPEDREAFKRRMADAFPQMKEGAIPVNAGQLFRFTHEAALGDVVAYPSKRDRQICLGHITGEYQYRPDLEPTYPHQRSVEWVREVPRSQFSQGALYEIGSAMSFFQIK